MSKSTFVKNACELCHGVEDEFELREVMGSLPLGEVSFVNVGRSSNLSQEALSRPAHHRLARVELLPDKLRAALWARTQDTSQQALEAQRQEEAQAKRRRQDELQRHAAEDNEREKQQKRSEAERKRKKEALPGMLARAAKIHSHLLACMAAAAHPDSRRSSGASGGAGEGRTGAEREQQQHPQQGQQQQQQQQQSQQQQQQQQAEEQVEKPENEEEQEERRQLAALLAQTELPEAQLRQLLGKAGVSKTDQQAVLQGLQRARGEQPLIFKLPAHAASLLGLGEELKGQPGGAAAAADGSVGGEAVDRKSVV